MKTRNTKIKKSIFFKSFHSKKHSKLQKDNYVSFKKSGYATFICLSLLAVLQSSQIKAQLYWRIDGTSATLTSSNWSVTGSSPYTSAWVNGSNIVFQATSAITNVTNTPAGNITVNPGAIVTWTAAGTFNPGGAIRTVDIGNGSTLTWNGQNISTSAGNGFIKNGAGTWDIGAQGNSYPGGFTLNAGTIIISNNSSLGSGAWTFNGGTIQSSGTRVFSNNITVGGDLTFTGTGNATHSGTVGLGAATRNITNSTTSGSRIFSGVISGGPGAGSTALSFGGSGGGTIDITNTGNSFTGNISISGAEVTFAADGSFGATPASVTANNIVIDGGRMTLIPPASTTYTLNANRGIQVGSSANTAISVKTGVSVTYNGVIADKPSGTGVLTKQGGAILILGGNSTYSGATSINNGTIQLSGGSDRLPVSTSLNLGQAASSNLGTFDLNGNNQRIAGLSSISGSNATTSNNTITSLTAATLTINVSAGINTYGDGSNANSGVISGAISIIKTGSGIQVLGDSNTYTGSTMVTTGELRFNNPALGANLTGSAVTLNGGILGTTGIGSGRLIAFSTLNLTDNSRIDLDSVNAHTVTFAASNLVSWTSGKTLTITGWQGAFNGTAGTKGKIFIGSSASGLSAGQITQVIFRDNNNVNYPATLLSSGEIVPLSSCTAPSGTAVSGNSPVCANGTLNLSVSVSSGTTPFSYAWTGTGTFSSSSVSNPSVTGAASGYYKVTVSNGCGSVSDSSLVIVNANVIPSVTIAVSPDSMVCSGTSVTFTATPVNGGSTPSYQWTLNGSNAGTNSAVYSSSSLLNGDQVLCVMTSNATCASPVSDVSNTITMTVNPNVTPSVTIVANPDSVICSGTNVTFTATPLNGGPTPSYQWKLNGNNVGTNSTTYSNSSLADGDYLECVLTPNALCLTMASATSNRITMHITTSVTPSASIGANPGTTVCAGTNVIFTAIPANGGATPSYQWKLNGNNVGTNSSTYSNTSLADNDQVNCIMISSSACASPATATSDTISMTVNAVVIPSVSLSASPDDTVCSGTPVTFTATAVNGGSSPAYQWKLNGSNAGTNSNAYSSASLSTGDKISCVLTSNAVCATLVSVSSDTINMMVNAIPAIAITPSAASILAGDTITLTASGTSQGYTWTPGGATTAVIQAAPLITTTYSVTGISSAGCINSASAVVTVIPRFAAGNLVLERVGAGDSILNGNARPVFLDQYSPVTANQVAPFSSYKFQLLSPRPTAAPFNLGESGSATSNGYMNLSSDGNYICVPGYNALYSESGVAGSSAAIIARTIGIASSSGALSTPNALNMLTGNNYRSLISDGVSFWAAGAAGVVCIPGVSSSTVNQVNAINVRVLKIFGSKLYYSTNSGTPGIYKFNGLPTTTAAASLVIGTTGSPFGFAFNPAGNVCYVADDGTGASGGIQKWTFNGTSWSQAYVLGTGISGIGARGLTVDFSGASPVIYATTADANRNRIIAITDAGASSSPLTLAKADTLKIFRGITFTPLPSLIVSSLAYNGAFGNVTVGTAASATSFNVRGNVLRENILINTPSPEFEIKKSSDPVNNFSSSPITLTAIDGVVPETSIDVRFKPASSGIKSGIITIASAGTATQTLAVSGTGILTAIPVLTIDQSGFTNSFGNIPVGYSSPGSHFSVSGSNLISYLRIAPPAGFQVSLDSLSWISNPDSIVISQSGGVVNNTVVYTRFIPYATGLVSGNIVCSSTDAASQPVAVNGTGTPAPVGLKIISVNGGKKPLTNQPFSVIVGSVDSNDAPQNVVAGTGIQLGLGTGTGSLTGTLTGTLAAGTNTVTLSGVLYTITEPGVIVTATRLSGDALASGNSGAFTVLPDVYPYTGGTYTQDFNSLDSNVSSTFSGNNPFYVAGNPVNDSAMIGWQGGGQTGGTNFNFRSDDGTSTTGSVFSYGARGSSDRAYGSLATSAMIPAVGWVLKNNTSAAYTAYVITYKGEQWRNGGSGTPNTLLFSYALNGTNIFSGTFNQVSALNFQSKISASGSGVNLNGNDTANQRLISDTVYLSDNWLPGQNLVIRWLDTNDPGSDDGLALDDFTFTAITPSTPILQDSSIVFTNVHTTSMNVGWTNGNGASRIAVINTANTFTDPADGTTIPPNTAYSGSGEQVIYNGSGNSVHVSGLTAGSAYFFRVYSYNGFAASSRYNTTSAFNNPNNHATAAAAPPTQLVITSINGGVSPVQDQPFTVTVESLDSSGNQQNVTVNTDVELYVSTGIGNLYDTIDGMILAGTHSVTIIESKYDFPDDYVILGVTSLNDPSLADGFSDPFAVTGVATQLGFFNVPSSGVIDSLVSSFNVFALRDNATVDPDYADSITISILTGPAGGHISGTLTRAAVNGVASFTDIKFDLDGTYKLQATAPGLASANSQNIIITLHATLTELVVPKYIGCKTASGTNTGRTPFAVCLQIDHLVPGTDYNLKLSVGLTSDNDSIYGAGNLWTGAGFSGSTIGNAFTTNASGSSGPYWVFIQPTGSGTRFDAGQVHNIRVGVAPVGSLMPSHPVLKGNKTITALDVSPSARTGSTADDGAFLKGSADACMSGKFVLVYSNTTGTGDPLFAYQIRQAIPIDSTPANYASLPSSIADVYLQNGTSATGDYVAVIPTGANNPNGVRRIEARYADNTIASFAIAADGRWSGGAATDTITRTQVAIISKTDASLNTVSAAATATDVTCNSGNDGNAAAVVIAGTAPLNYSWNTTPQQMTSTATGLTAGHYIVTVTDHNGCADTASATVNQPVPIVITDFFPTACAGTIIDIVGTGFSGVTDVFFNSTSAASFTVSGDTLIDAEVPVGATSGLITVMKGVCSGVSSSAFIVTTCGVSLDVKVFMQGYYAAGGYMKPVLSNEGVAGATAGQADSVLIELHDADSPFALVDVFTGIVGTDGMVSCLFTNGAANSTPYYIVIKNRNSIPVWSAIPFAGGVYDFTSGSGQAYQNQVGIDPPPFTLSPMTQVEPGVWAIYNGDVALGDGVCDVSDFNVMEADAATYVADPVPGYYKTDITGDGFPDVTDFNLLELNVSNFFVVSQFPH